MKNNQSERKKSSMPLRINRKSFLGVLSLIVQELIESISTKFNLNKPKEDEVLFNDMVSIQKYVLCYILAV